MKKIFVYILLTLFAIQLLKAQNIDSRNDSFSSSLKFSDVDSTIVNIEDFYSNVTVLYFWTSWSGESRKQMQYMLSLSRKMAFRPVSFVSVSLDINRDVWLNFVKRLGTTGGLIHLYAGKDREIIKEFGIVSVPSVVILNKDKYMIPSGNPYNIPDKLEETLLGILRDKDDSSPLSDSLSLIK